MFDFHLGAIFCCGGSVTKTPHTIGQSIGSLRAHWRLTRANDTRGLAIYGSSPKLARRCFDPSPHLDEATLRLYVFNFSTRTVPNCWTLIELLQFKQLNSSTAPRPRGLSISEPGSQALLVIKWVAHVFGPTPSHIFFVGGEELGMFEYELFTFLIFFAYFWLWHPSLTPRRCEFVPMITRWLWFPKFDLLVELDLTFRLNGFLFEWFEPPVEVLSGCGVNGLHRWASSWHLAWGPRMSQGWSGAGETGGTLKSFLWGKSWVYPAWTLDFCFFPRASERKVLPIVGV